MPKHMQKGCQNGEMTHEAGDIIEPIEGCNTEIASVTTAHLLGMKKNTHLSPFKEGEQNMLYHLEKKWGLYDWMLERDESWKALKEETSPTRQEAEKILITIKINLLD